MTEAKPTLLERLEKLLKQDDRLVADSGELLKNKTAELAEKLDERLIQSLLSDAELKQHFFKEVGGATIFDKDTFTRFITSKEFLPDSYTAFKNKIGLTDDNGNSISKKEDVVLSWPYKDCVLEGGQTKEDAKRDEIFWNETLAPDEIRRLLEPKAFTNAKRVDANGEKKLKEFNTNEQGDITDNLVVKGNNLLALHSLKERFAGKVKLIYIDPPFNTETDSFKYNDKFSRSTWLSFLKNRIIAAKQLLSDDGSLYLHLDYNEVHYAKIVLDEIFGEENFVNEIIWHYHTGGATENKFSLKHDTILFYAKNDEKRKFNSQREPYREDQTNHFTEVDEDGRRYRIRTVNGREYHYYLDEGRICHDVWDIESVNAVARERVEGFYTQKPEKLLERIISASSDAGDLIIDFFSGSGSTGAVAHKLGRQYILVEQMDSQIDIMKDRLQEVVNGDRGGISEQVGWTGGGDFVHLELAKWNQKFKEQVEKAGSKKKLQELWKTLQEKARLSYKVDLKKIDENAKEFADLSLENQKKFLLEMLDQNHLYINCSDIDDKECGVSKDDKEVNKKFYNQ